MKTNELIEKLEKECEVKVVVDINYNKIYCYSIYNSVKRCEVDWWFKLDNLKDSQANLTINEGACIKQHYAKALKYIAEYFETPMEERHEIKKYRLRIPNGFSAIQQDTHLNLDREYKTFIIDSPIETELYQTIFTQKEIDSMPQGFKEFFIKEEVE